MKNIDSVYGAIAGDIIGSVYEFWGLCGDEPLLTEENSYTDDSILTLAVADAIMSEGDVSFATALRTYATLYPRPMGGYGGRFVNWLCSGANAQPYNSYGNGSAMRCSACAAVAKSIDEAIALARKSAECTHNHPEGIKGAEATAAAAFMAKEGKTKDEIRQYINDRFYKLSTIEELYSREYEFHATCQDTVPEALVCFLDSTSYEECIRYAMLTNLDTDTAAAIAGAVAGAFYGVPQYIKDKVRDTLDVHLLNTLDEFEKYITKQ